MGKKDKRTNITRLMNERGIVEQAITEFERGVVKVGYEEWSAESEDGQPIDKGEIVVKGEPTEVVNSPIFYDVYMGEK